MTKVAVVGTGYVGLVTGTCLSEIGHRVICVDIDSQKIDNLKKGIIPIYEPGLEELVKKNFKKKRLDFTTDLSRAIKESEIIFIAVGTPTAADGSVNLEYVKKVAEEIGKSMDGYRVVVNKSTVPIGTGDLVARIISSYFKGEFEVVSNPEFLREGCAVDDFMKPDRIVIGNGESRAKKIMVELYSALPGERVLTDVKTAEMIKYASNAYLATSISFINSIANICEKVGADVTEVALGMRLDKRIGKYAFLDAGPGYGGSCFPKDVKGMIQIASEHNVNFSILEAVEGTNEAQKMSLLPKIQKLVGKDLHRKKITIWGLAFKAETDDIREAPALTLIKQLQDRDAYILIYDPVAREQGEKMDSSLVFANDLYESVKGAQCLVIVTEWKQFREVNLEKVKSLLKSPNIVDGRNLYSPGEMKKMGFNYISVGR